MSEFTERTPALLLADLRENYTRCGLLEENCQTNPIVQFSEWFTEAQRSGLKEPNAMTLATATPDGRPSARIVLLKEVSDDGFVFYTNYESRKGRELDANPFAALTFYWAELERQVRVEGAVHRVSREQSNAYFETRPKGSRLGAWVSHQSEVVPSRKHLEVKLKDLEARYAETEKVPLPEFWGGYALEPEMIEFWQGRPNRLHDRIRFRRDEKEDNRWIRERLSP